MATKINEPVRKTIELTEVEAAAYEGLTHQQQELQRQAMEIQGRIVKISQEVFGSRDIEFTTVQNPSLSDDKKSITYEVVKPPKTEKTQDKDTKGE